MSYCLLQKSLEIPATEKLRHAFRAVSCLTDSDAHMLAKDAYGILVTNMEYPNALTLQTALQEQQIETEVVLQSNLPPLPPLKYIRQVNVTPDALMVFDPLGRPFPVAWENIVLISAGKVLMVEEKRVVNHVRLMGSSAVDDDFPAKEYSTQEVRNYRSILELTLKGGKIRFNIQAHRFLFTCLGDRRTRDADQNFITLIRDIINHTPHAILGRGAYFLRNDPPQFFTYPSRNAFHEETIWLLWRIQQAQNRGT